MIECKNVSFGYNTEETVLKNISLTIEEGSFVSIIGHNGSGKSTLAKIFNGLLEPTEGHVLVEGLDTKDQESIYAIRENVGMVFQNPDNQMVATMIEEDVAFGPENLGLPREEIRKRVDEALEDVGMTSFMKTSPYHLSGGQKQRIAIAGILAMRPKYIIFDEATSMLDPQGKIEVMESIKKLHRDGYTIIHITHFMDEVLNSQRVILMEEGRILADGKPRDFFAETELQEQLDFQLPLYVAMSREIQKEKKDFPLCFTREEMLEALCPLL